MSEPKPPRVYLTGAQLLAYSEAGGIGPRAACRIVAEVFRLRAKVRYLERRLRDVAVPTLHVALESAALSPTEPAT